MTKKYVYTTPASTVFRIFEIYERMAYNESGEKVVWTKPVPPDPNEKKQRTRLT